MGDYSAEEAAERAGTSVEYLAELVEARVLVPADGRFTEGDVLRASMVQMFTRSGIPLDRLAAALRERAVSLDFLDGVEYNRFAAYRAETFEELSARSDIPIDVLMIIREVMRSAQPAPTDRVRENDLSIVPLLQLTLEEGFGASSTERLLRVMSDSLRRVAETEAEWWYSNVLAPRLAQGLRGSAVEPESSGRMSVLLDETVLANYHAQQAHTWMANVIRATSAQLAAAGLHATIDRPPAICFLDITGYTRLTQERGDTAAADLASQLAKLVQRTSLQHGGRPIKWLGDGVMFYFEDPGEGVVAALEMVAGVAAAGLPPAHVGLHSGPVLFQQGDYFGQTVNVASRIAEFARAGEVLVSQEVVDASQGSGPTYTEIGPVELKGMSGAM